MKTIFENEKIKVQETGRNYDFIATVSNLTDDDIIISYDYDYDTEQFSIDGQEWVGICANDEGYAFLQAVTNKDFNIFEA